AGFISILDASPASPYPSTIEVSGITEPISSVVVTINSFAHAFPEDIGMLLVGPGEQTVMLMDSVGGGTSVSGIALGFDDAAPTEIASSTLASGNYRPTGNNLYSLNFPAPSSPYGNTLAPLAASPNGTWSLFVQDFAGEDAGSITGGWTLQLISSNRTTTSCATLPAARFTSTSYSNNVMNFSWSTIPGPHYQVQYRTNLADGSWINLGPPIPGTNTLLTITDVATNGPTRFYRVQSQP
ncbi:MAG: hypothetical protein H7Y43_03355, partial [Akkermansiaceae bacterium]|nr:hypothetical protein [Verrucomicrobiales bacterium]